MRTERTEPKSEIESRKKERRRWPSMDVNDEHKTLRLFELVEWRAKECQEDII